MIKKIVTSEHIFVNQKELSEMTGMPPSTLIEYTRAGILRADEDGLYDLIGGGRLIDRLVLIKQGYFAKEGGGAE
ncbi:MAG: hypothetical protein JXA07_06835 [Spirochaetes bacterium]|nr:hypothetical protein [Spirochaetota bacterium]